MAFLFSSTWGVWLVSLLLESILYGMGLLQIFLYFQWYPNDVRGLKIMIEFFSICLRLLYNFILHIAFSNLMDHVILQIVASAMKLSSLIKIGVTATIVSARYTPAQVVQTLQISSFVELSGAKDMTSLQSATSLALDSLITITLVLVLGGNKGEIKQTNSMLNKLIIYAINRGFLTAFLAVPGTFYFFLGLVPSSKCKHFWHSINDLG
ncbi:MAG: hypothetical protein NXY57DRAFT_1040438 [Lentinula lateritia]|nr:MAG: hypothetical protein NXY57DRAFT_1040438 [Lentinula lateritia]